MISKLELLEQSAFATHFSLKEKVLWSNYLKPVYLAKDEVYAKPGDASDGCVILGEGQLELRKETSVHLVKAGESFGFLGTLQPGVRALMVTALEKSTLLVFSYTQLSQLKANAPILGEKLSSVLWALSFPAVIHVKNSLLAASK